MDFVYDDGGRAKAGFKGKASDCVTRAIAIATGQPYADVYKTINALSGSSVARTGVPKDITKAVMSHYGFAWISTMTIGQGCKTHLVAQELPKGVLIARLTRHVCAIKDGVIYDTHNPARGGKRCVYGYWQLN